MEEILNESSHFIVWKDRNAVFLGCNQQFSQLAGFQYPEQVIGKTDYEMPWKENAISYITDDQNIMLSGIPKLNYEESQYQKDGTRKVMLVSKLPIFDNNKKSIGILSISTNLDEYKKMAQINKELEETVAAINAKLTQANAIIQSKNIEQTMFIQNMQHDFRTPISGAWSMLNQLTETETEPARKELLALVRDANKQFYDVCTEIIDFDKIDRNELPIIAKKFSLEDVIQNVIELHRPIAVVQKLFLIYNIDSGIPQVVSGDRYRINRILINLVANAIKFTHSGGVSVTASLAKMSGENVTVQIVVADTGIGIPADKQNLIYTQFNRLTPANAGVYKGLGLGLNIVQRFVADIGGEIELNSEIDKGTTFCITCVFKKPLLDKIYTTIPIDHQDAELVTPSLPKIDANMPPPHLLLIEDNPLARFAALSLLQSSIPCTVNVAENVAQAKELLATTKFDLVISDLGLPDGSGNDIVLATKASKQDLNYHTPFIALTAHSDIEKTTQAENDGFLLTLTKPLLKNQIKSLIDTYVKQQDTVLTSEIA